MIISEKQIVALITLVRNYTVLLYNLPCPNGAQAQHELAIRLLDEIAHQTIRRTKGDSMNELTKEEIHEIKREIEKAYQNLEPFDSPLLKRIQYAIDSFCEHESDGLMHLSDPIQYKCKKCGEFYR